MSKSESANGEVITILVEDIVERTSSSNFPAIGEMDKLYLETDTNNFYRWNGNAYVLTKATTDDGSGRCETLDETVERLTNIHKEKYAALAEEPGIDWEKIGQFSNEELAPTEIPLDKTKKFDKVIEKTKEFFLKLTHSVIYLYLCFTTVLIVLVASVAWYGWYTKDKDHVVDTRPCALLVGDYELTGRREYSYQYNEIFGFRFINKKMIDTKTIIDVRGTKISIIGLTNDKWWTKMADTGEQGVLILNPADTLIFTINDKVNVVKNSALCK